MDDMSVIVLVSAASTAAHAVEIPPAHELIMLPSSDFVTAPTVAHKTSATTRESRDEKPGRMVGYLAHAIVFPPGDESQQADSDNTAANAMPSKSITTSCICVDVEERKTCLRKRTPLEQ